MSERPDRRHRAIVTGNGAIRAIQAGLVVVVLVGWEALARSQIIAELFLPAPSAIAAAFPRLITESRLPYHLGVTLLEFAWGYAISVVLGIALGLAVGLAPLFERLVDPFLSAAMAVPKVAVVPLLTLWFGIGIGHKVVLVVLLSFFPILYATIAGVKQTDRSHANVARALGASRLQRVTKVVLASATPSIFAGLRVAASSALVGALFAEMIASKAGLGNLLVRATAGYDTPQTFALIIVVMLLAVAIIGVIGLLERHVFLAWRKA